MEYLFWKFINDMAPAAIFGTLFCGIPLLVVFWLQWRAGKETAGETTRKHGRASTNAPITQDAYDVGQTERDGKIILAQYYRRYGTEKQKAQAILDLKKLGIVFAE